MTALRVARVVERLPSQAQHEAEAVLRDLLDELALEPERWLPLSLLARDRVLHEPFDEQPRLVRALLDEFTEVAVEAALARAEAKEYSARQEQGVDEAAAVIAPTITTPGPATTPRTADGERRRPRHVTVSLRRARLGSPRWRADGSKPPTVRPDRWQTRGQDTWELSVAELDLDDGSSLVLLRVSLRMVGDQAVDLSAEDAVELFAAGGRLVKPTAIWPAPDRWLGALDFDGDLEVRVQGLPGTITVQIAGPGQGLDPE